MYTLYAMCTMWDEMHAHMPYAITTFHLHICNMQCEMQCEMYTYMEYGISNVDTCRRNTVCKYYSVCIYIYIIVYAV